MLVAKDAFSQLLKFFNKYQKGLATDLFLPTDSRLLFLVYLATNPM
jgi:hypothetical protein